MAVRRSKETAKQWQQGTWRLIALKRLLFRQTPAGHETRRVLHGEPAFRRDSRNSPGGSQKRTSEMSVCTRRPPKGKIPRASERQIAEQVSVLFLLRLKSVISALSILGQTFPWSREHTEANGGSTLLSRLVFRWTRDQERMATHCSEELQRTTAGIGCRNSHLKSAPTGHCHTSDMEHKRQGHSFSWREHTYIVKPISQER